MAEKAENIKRIMSSYLRMVGGRIKWLSNVLHFRNEEDTEYRDISVRSLELRRTTGINKVSLAIASEPEADRLFNFPVTYGATGQVLTDDGAGNLYFTSIALVTNAVRAEDQLVEFNSSSPVTVVSLPAGVTIQLVTVDVETAFNGTPSLSVGLAGDTAKYFEANDVELTTAAIYETKPMSEEAGAVSPIITYSAGDATVGSARVTVQWALPG